ncbi:MAG: 1,2-phenylacetyl-CoA epoxidase subunit PaaD [Sulfobacillus sp.]
MTSKDQIIEVLRQVMDPEIPGLSIVDLGMVGDVSVEGDTVHIDLIPTFLGCPALDFIARNVEKAMAGRPVAIRWVHDQPWSSSMISARGRQALSEWGIAPPSEQSEVTCPFCGSHHTSHTSPFGPALCRAVYYCHDCAQPFEKIKTV